MFDEDVERSGCSFPLTSFGIYRVMEGVGLLIARMIE